MLITISRMEQENLTAEMAPVTTAIEILLSSTLLRECRMSRCMLQLNLETMRATGEMVTTSASVGSDI